MAPGRGAVARGGRAPSPIFFEQVVFQMNLSFTRALDAAGVLYGKDFYLGGYHG